MLKLTVSGAVPVMNPPTAAGVERNTAFGGWFPLAGVVPGLTLTAAEQRALWVAVLTSKDAV
jgi:hypothetical protein